MHSEKLNILKKCMSNINDVLVLMFWKHFKESVNFTGITFLRNFARMFEEPTLLAGMHY